MSKSTETIMLDHNTRLVVTLYLATPTTAGDFKLLTFKKVGSIWFLKDNSAENLWLIHKLFKHELTPREAHSTDISIKKGD